MVNVRTIFVRMQTTCAKAAGQPFPLRHKSVNWEVAIFDSAEHSDSSRRISTITLLVLAFIFSPALLIAIGSGGYVATIIAATFSTLCVFVVWLTRKKPAAARTK